MQRRKSINWHKFNVIVQCDSIDIKIAGEARREKALPTAAVIAHFLNAIHRAYVIVRRSKVEMHP